VAHNNLGAAYELTGRTDEAVAEYGTALRLDPDLAQARDNLERLRGGDDG
jgi:Flp pilus assembly protein TadD